MAFQIGLHELLPNYLFKRFCLLLKFTICSILKHSQENVILKSLTLSMLDFEVYTQLLALLLV